MSCETRARAKNRPTTFDSNRSIIIENKKKKDNSTDPDMAEANPSGDNSGPFPDHKCEFTGV